MTKRHPVTIVYCHGVGGDPNKGMKVSAIRKFAEDEGINVLAPRFDEQSSIEQMACDLARSIESSNVVLPGAIFVGSSRGAFICASATRLHFSDTPGGMVLLSPPIGIRKDFYGSDFPVPNARSVDIIHGFQDQLIPARNVVEYCTEHGIRLHLVNEGHRLTAERDFIVELIRMKQKLIVNDSKFST